MFKILFLYTNIKKNLASPGGRQAPGVAPDGARVPGVGGDGARTYS